MKKRLTFLVALLMVALSALAVSASAVGEQTFPPTADMGDAVIKYRGLSARTADDFAGLRAIFEVDDTKIARKTAVYGAVVAKAGAALPTVTIANGVATAVGDDATAVTVYSSVDPDAATGTYCDKTENRSFFAYTVAYFHEQQYNTYLQADLVFRAFYQINGGEVQYVDMDGSLASGASIADVCTELVKDPAYADNIGINRVIRKQNYTGVLQSEYDAPLNDLSKASATKTTTLANMEAGLYKVVAMGVSVTAWKGAGFVINDSQEYYGFVNAQARSTSSAFSFFCVLNEGTNTLNWGFAADNVVLSNLHLTLVRSFPEGTFKTSLIKDGAEGITKTTTADTLTTAEIGSGKTVSFSLNAPKKGTYDAYILFNTKTITTRGAFAALQRDEEGAEIFVENMQFSFQVGTVITRKTLQESNINHAVDASRENINGANNRLGTRAYALVGTVEFTTTESTNVTFSWTGTSVPDNTSLWTPSIIFVPVDNHTVDFVYDDAEGNEHILSRQTVKTGDAAILPTNPLPKAFASVALADGETTANITADKKIKLNVTWK